MDFFAIGKDYSVVVALVGGVVLYFKWQEKKKEMISDLAAERAQHRADVEEVIKMALNNGIGARIREVINEALREHERVESANVREILAAFRAENTEAHKSIGQRVSDSEQRVAILESKWASVLGPVPKGRKGS